MGSQRFRHNLVTEQQQLGVQCIKNLPADAGDTSLIFDPGRVHTLQSNVAHVPHNCGSPRALGPLSSKY